MAAVVVKKLKISEENKVINEEGYRG